MKTELERVGCFPPSIFNSMQVYDWLRGPIFQSGDPPPLVVLSWQRVLFHSSSHTALPGGTRADMHHNWCCLRWRKGAVLFFRFKTNGWLHRTSKLHLDWISTSCFQQLLFNGTGQCSIQLRSHSPDMPAHWILSLLYHPFVSCVKWKR